MDLRPLEARTVSGNAARTTAVALRQTDDGSYGALVDHVVSFAGDDGRADVSSKFLQPILAKAIGRAFTLLYPR